MNSEDFQPVQLQISHKLKVEVLQPLKELFVGKGEIVDLLGVCLTAGEHLFLLGPPGTAKSALVQELAKRIDGRVFDYLLTRFTEPNELFGPFDIRRLREGELITNTEGMLPEATFIFLDELLNANSAILNSLLLVLNERVFRRGRETRALPMLMVVGASNRLPQDEALGALFDRFLARVRCDNVPNERLNEVLAAGWKLGQHQQTERAQITVDELRSLQSAVLNVELTGVRTAYLEVINNLRRAGIAVSDRRAVKLQRMVAASALLCGRTAANRTDLWVLRYIWDTDEQREIIAAIVQSAVDQADAQELANAHPRAQGDRLPNPEELARDLEQLTLDLDNPEIASHERSAMQDRLALLAGRSSWVGDAQARDFLESRIKGLWQRLGLPA